MSRPRIKITLIDQKGTMGCHRGHKVGDSYDFDTDRGKICPMAMHVAFPYEEGMVIETQRGLDAVLVQDLGAAGFLKKHFPDLPLHASTQMTVTSISSPLAIRSFSS